MLARRLMNRARKGAEEPGQPIGDITHIRGNPSFAGSAPAFAKVSPSGPAEVQAISTNGLSPSTQSVRANAADQSITMSGLQTNPQVPNFGPTPAAARFAVDQNGMANDPIEVLPFPVQGGSRPHCIWSSSSMITQKTGNAFEIRDLRTGTDSLVDLSGFRVTVTPPVENLGSCALIFDTAGVGFFATNLMGPGMQFAVAQEPGPYNTDSLKVLPDSPNYGKIRFKIVRSATLWTIWSPFLKIRNLYRIWCASIRVGASIAGRPSCVTAPCIASLKRDRPRSIEGI